MQTLKFLGRGSAFNVKEGNTSAYIKDGEDLLLIDCGESIFQRILERNLLDDVKEVHVLITHLNSDHVGSLSSLIFYCYFIKKITPTIYFPNKKIKDLLHIMGHNDEQFNTINPTEGFTQDISEKIYFKFMPISHIEGMECYWIGLVFNDRTIYYSGDANEIPTYILVQLKYGIIDEFYQDTCLADYNGNVHLSLRKLCEDIPKEIRNRVYCMHIDCDELIEKAKSEGFNVVEL